MCRCLNVKILWKCVLSPLFCKNCAPLCGTTPHSCCRCNDPMLDQADECPCNDNIELFGSGPCCCQCCIQIPMIKLKCPEDPGFTNVAPSLLPAIFAARRCNATYIPTLYPFLPVPMVCFGCGTVEFPMIGAWISCKLEGLAAALNMLKFDFYNDWVNGTLYFPLIKRKLKLKKKKRKFGEIKYDKFCDFDCDDFQDPNKILHRTVIRNENQNESVEIVVPTTDFPDGCKFTFTAGETIVTQWLRHTSSPYDIPISRSQMELLGEDVINGDPCIIKFNNYVDQTTSLYAEINSNINLQLFNYIADPATRLLAGEHDFPFYVSGEDPGTGLQTKINIGGHGHHRNKCNNTHRVERLEFWKEDIDCEAVTLLSESNAPDDIDDYIQYGLDGPDVVEEPPDDDPDGHCANNDCNNNPFDNCAEFGPGCTGNGVKTCTALCWCNKKYNDNNIKHGIVKYEEGVLYYPAIIPFNDDTYNPKEEEYKSNLLLPTDICELGSSVFCDIDDSPFIMDKLIPTTFSVSEESEKITSPPFSTNVLEVSPKGKSALNVQAYAEFGCIAANCMNIFGIVNSSQLGVETIDEDDTGRSLGACKLRFDHDEEVREYFCKRFSTFDRDLIVNYQRPGSTEFENRYETYPDSIDTGSTVYTILPDSILQIDSINDGDPWTPGDRCGTNVKSHNLASRYFYGLAPGRTIYYSSKFPTANSTAIVLDSDQSNGINLATTQTPYYFYFGIIPGKTALHKVVSKYFADKINKTTLVILDTNKSSQILHNKSNFRTNIKTPHSILKSCLGERTIIPADE